MAKFIKNLKYNDGTNTYYVDTRAIKDGDDTSKTLKEKLTGMNTAIDAKAAKVSMTAGTYKSVTVNGEGVVTAGTNPTTLAGYGITDAKIDTGVITLGSSTITPALASDLTAHTGNTSNPHSVTAAQVGLGNVDNTADADKPISTATQTALDAKAPLASPALTGTPTAPTAEDTVSTTQIATTAFVQAVADKKIAAAHAMIFKGTIGTGGTVSTLPSSTAKIGWTYVVITAGTYDGHDCEVGDMLIAITDGSTSTAAEWTVVQANINGAVTGPTSSVTEHIATFNGTTGKVIKDSGYTIATSVPSGAVFTDTVTTIASTTGDGNAITAITANNGALTLTKGTTFLTAADVSNKADKSTTTTAGDYTKVSVNAQGIVTGGSNPTTIAGYGITDAKIDSGVITLGSNTITPVTSGTTSGTGNVLTGVSVSGGTMTLSQGTMVASATTSGTGNAFNGVSVSGGTMTLAKGTFAEIELADE